MKCDRCGVEGVREEAFFKARRNFSTRFRYLCPSCWRTKRERLYWTVIALYLVYGVAGAALAVAGKRIGWLFLNVFLFEFFIILATVLHEFGHAFVARLVGMRVFEVNLGFGKPVYERRLRDFWIVINMIPYSGRVRTIPCSLSWFRLRYWLCVAAGPLANFLAAGLVWPCVGRLGLVSLADGLRPAAVFLGANLLTAFSTLVPRRYQGQLGVTGSDGLQLIRIPFLSNEKIRTLLAMRLVLEGFTARRSGDFNLAGQWYAQAVSEYPDNFVVRNDAAINLLDQGRLEDAREQFVRTLESMTLKPLEKALTQNNLAYVNARLDRDDLLDEADRLSKEALAVFPTAAFVKGTRGSVLCKLGRFEEGMPLLKQSMMEASDLKSKALNACDLALAEEKLGNIQGSEAFWKAAQELDPRCPMLRQRV